MGTNTVLLLLPSLRLAGAERQTVDLAIGLASEGFSVHVATFETDLTLLPLLTQAGVHHHNFPRQKKFDVSPVSKIAGLIDEHSVGVLYCTLQIAFLFGVLARARAGTKPRLINAVHTTVNRDVKHETLDRFVYAPLMRKCDAIVTVCESQRVYWARKYPSLGHRMLTIHNGVDAKQFSDDIAPAKKAALRSQLGISDGDLIIGMLAGFRHEKNHEQVFEAFRDLVQLGLPVRLLLVGDGDRRTHLQSKAVELGIAERVIWAGFQRDAKDYISIFDIGVLFSYAVETFSVAILEMLSMGKPVVAADIGGTCEMVENECNGYLVAVRDVRDLASKLQVLIEDKERRLAFGAEARRTVCERYTRSQMVNKNVGLLQQLLLLHS